MKRLLSKPLINNCINIMYFDDVVSYMCQFYTIKEVLVLASLSRYHLNIIRSTPLYHEFKPSTHFPYGKLITMLKHHQFKNLDLTGTFVYNKNMEDVKNALKLNISNTFVNEKCLDLLTGPYDSLIVSKDVLRYIFSYRYVDEYSIDCNPPTYYELSCHKKLVNAISPYHNTALIELLQYIKHTNITTTQYMINHGVDINAVNNDNKTALSYAIINDQQEMIKLLINHGARVNQSHLKLAIHNPIIALLIPHCCDIDECDCNDVNLPPVCILSLSIYMKLDGLAQLIMRHINLSKNKCALRMAVYMQNLLLVKLLLKESANPLLSDSILLINIVKKINYDMINVFAKYELNRQDGKGRTAIMVACKQHDIKLVRHLISLSNTDEYPIININLTDNDGNNLLMLYLKYFNCYPTAKEVHLENVQYLKALCSMNDVNNEGNTVLMIAIKYVKDLNIIYYLIDQCNVNQVNVSGKTVYSLVLENSQDINIIQYLINKGNPGSLILEAIQLYCGEIVEYCIDHHYDDITDNDGNHALIHLIKGNYNIRLVRKMVDKHKDNDKLITQCYHVANEMDFSDMFALLNNLSIVTLLKQYYDN